MFESIFEGDCNKCGQKTIQKDSNKYIIPPYNKFVIIRINNYTHSSNGNRIRNNSEITNFDCNNLYIPNDNNIRFRVKSVIMHFSSTNNNGHYIVWTRFSIFHKWLRIDDISGVSQVRNFANLKKSLTDVYLIYLEKI